MKAVNVWNLFIKDAKKIISVFIYAKEIAFVNPDVASNFIKTGFIFSHCHFRLQW